MNRNPANANLRIHGNQAQADALNGLAVPQGPAVHFAPGGLNPAHPLQDAQEEVGFALQDKHAQRLEERRARALDALKAHAHGAAQ